LTVQAGPKAVARTAHRLGIVSHLMAVPSLALGSETVTPLELTGAYVPFANGGTRAMPYAIREIRTRSGHVLYRRKAAEDERVMSPGHAAEMAELMVGTVTEGTGRAAKLDERPSAGKTGTTQDFRDAWFVGFTSDYVCGVWIGNDHNAPMKHVTGGTLPARVFKAFMEEAERGLPVEPLTSIRLAPPPPPPAVATVASADGVPLDGTPRAEAPSNDNVFDKLLDSLFGGHR
jgi:penicillin-binding protein 1A